MEETVFYLFAFLIIVSALAVVSLKNIFHCALFLILCLFTIAGIFILLQAEFLAVVQVLLYVGAIAILMIFAIMLTSRLAGREVMMTNEHTFLGGFLSMVLVFILIFSFVNTSFPTDSRFKIDLEGNRLPDAALYNLEASDSAEHPLDAIGLDLSGYPYYFQLRLDHQGAVMQVRLLNRTDSDDQNAAMMAGMKSLRFDAAKIPQDFLSGWFTYSYPADHFSNSAHKIGTRLMQAYVLPFELVSILLLAALIGAIVIARREGS